MRRRLSLLPALALLLGGCEIFEPAPPVVEGVWLVAARNVTDGRTVCDITGMELELRLDPLEDDRFTGLATSAFFSCFRGDTAVAVEFDTQPVINGRIVGDSVSFDVGTPLWSHRALIDGASMNGTVNLTLSGLADPTVLRGLFGAARTDSIF